MKVLCIGNNTVDTDVKTSNLAELDGARSYGLISELDNALPDIIQPGYYHSSVYDVEYHNLLGLAQKFDQVVILDQPREEYSHPDAFYKTIKLAKDLAQTQSVKFLDPSYSTAINFFEQLVVTNKSFCIFPFIELLTNNGSTTVCCRSYHKIKKLSDLKDFQTDEDYVKIRNKMLAGKLLPEHCSSCYRLEDQGIVSARIHETVEWANRLDLKSLEDLKAIQTPAYYEVRPSNICNLQCRSCDPQNSHLLAKEWKILNLTDIDFSNLEYTNFDFINFTNLKKLYVSGGEPTAMAEFYEFLDRCIDNQQTDFELLINTNGTKLSDRFKQQLEHFKSVSFIVSIDGYDQLNHYIRWPSEWDRIVENAQYLYEHFSISFNLTVSIYNVLTLDKLIQFLDTTFPRASIHCQFATTLENRLSALNFPYPELVANRLTAIQQLNCYRNDQVLMSFVDGLIKHYSQSPTVDLELLQVFFKFNDQLDQHRNIQLKDYVPELETARQLI
jgi:organic radical activating enzyme